MVRFSPLAHGPMFETSISNLDRLNLEQKLLTATFFLPGDDRHRLEVQVPGVEAMRSLDEMPFSTEDDQQHEGLEKDGFAYEVQNGYFWRCQSALMFKVHPLRHFCLITGWTCLDIIASQAPVFAKVPGVTASASSSLPKPVTHKLGDLSLLGHELRAPEQLPSGAGIRAWRKWLRR